MGYSVSMDGADAVIGALQLFGGGATKKTLRKSLRRAAKNTAEKAKANINSRSGQLRGTIKVRAGKQDRDAVSVAVISAGAAYGDVYYGAFLELGHKRGKRGTPNREQVEPKPYLRPAFDTTANAAQQMVIDDLNEQIADTLAKGNQ